MAKTLGYHLVNSRLPSTYQLPSGAKSVIKKTLSQLARENPTAYAQAISDLKDVGDLVATSEGITVGLDDIEPDYKKRDAIVKPAFAAFKATNSLEQKRKILLDAQSKIQNDYTLKHPGSLTGMVSSGARGSSIQSMKIVGAPILATSGEQEEITPWMITKSYSEGLRPHEYWAASDEARMNEIKTRTSVSEPGDMAKVIVNNMRDQVVTELDCGTRNGVTIKSDSEQVTDRYLARDTEGVSRNTLLNGPALTALRKKSTYLLVRSPMTCEANKGICQMCYGLLETGKPPPIGTNVGVRSAQALSEPLTQFALNAKHSVRQAKANTKELTGLKAVKHILITPDNFINKATLAQTAGTITNIVDKPLGKEVYIGSVRHFVPVGLDVLVSKGQRVERGDVLSDGVPKPDEVTQLKGLGAGRKYLVDTVHDLYKSRGSNVDRRHLELLSKSTLNKVKILDNDPKNEQFIKGDIVDYNRYKSVVGQDTRAVSAGEAVGKVLGEEVLHYTVGTEVTPEIAKEFKDSGVSDVRVAVNPPNVSFVHKSIVRNPLTDPDWLARLSHQYLKQSILQGAHFGEQSDLHGTNPVPAYIYGAEFGTGPNGRY